VIYLAVNHDSVLDVYDIETQKDRMGQICPSMEDQWAAYRANEIGLVQTKRIGTFDTIEEAAEAIVGRGSVRSTAV
jgi:hypothetical protein